MHLSLFHDKPDSAGAAERFTHEQVLTRLRATDERARTHGLDSLNPRDELVRLGMETNKDGQVTKNSLGVFHLPWLAAAADDWAERAGRIADELKQAIREAHGAGLRFVVWCGMGGSAEDKSLYLAAGLLRKGPRLYVLDTTEPEAMRAVFEAISERSQLPLNEVLKATLVVGQALGMTSFEPVLNLQRIAALYAKVGVDSRANIAYLTLSGSLLDQFGQEQGYRRIELQLDGGNSTSGRHSSPLTMGSLLPLALAHHDLEQWIKGAQLSDEQVQTAWRLAAFLHTQSRAGRDKITLMLPKEWAGAGVWTKQDFEESLGKSEEWGLKLLIGERMKLAHYHPPKDQQQDRVFLAFQVKKKNNPDAEKLSLLRRAGYPLAIVTAPDELLSRYMQFIHYVVFGIAWLERMNFVTQPSVELYKAVSAEVYEAAQQTGSVETTPAWQARLAAPERSKYRGGVTIHWGPLAQHLKKGGGSAAEKFGELVRRLAGSGAIEYGELTFFGDLKHSVDGPGIRKVLERGAERLFRASLLMPCDVGEGPGMNHSYHEMIIGHGRCLSCILYSEKSRLYQVAKADPMYHRAQILGTLSALERRGRFAVAISLRDTGEETLQALEEFFTTAAASGRRKSNT